MTEPARPVPTGWICTTLGEFIALQRGFDLPATRRRPGRYPIVSSGGVSGFHDTGPVKGPGLAIGRAANLGVPVWSDGDYWPLNTTLFVKDFRGNEPRFVFYLLQRLDLSGYNSGSVQPMLNRNYVAAVPLTVPAPAEQRAIARVLRVLDDKIESNGRCVALMVELAQAALLGDGARRVRLGDVATLDKGVSYKGAGLVDGPSPNARPLVNLGNFPVDSSWLNISKTKFYSGDYRHRHVVEAGDLVVANTDLTQQRAVLGRAALVPADLGSSLISHHVFAVRFHARHELRLPLWAQLATASARDRLTGYATGTTVAGLPKEALLDFMVSAPASGDVIAHAEALVEAAWTRESESAALISLRDALLPELLSGRIRVPEASEAVNQVLA